MNATRRWLSSTSKLLAAVAAVGLVVILAVVAGDAIVGRRDAFDALGRQAQQNLELRRAAARRIDRLTERIDQQATEIRLLREQLVALGETPVSPSESAAPSTGGGGSTYTTTSGPDPSPPPGPSPTAPPAPDPAPQPDPEPSPPPTAPPPEPEPEPLVCLPVVGCIDRP